MEDWKHVCADTTGSAGGYPPIADYAAVGDGRTVALVGRDGSVDWCCMPDIDSPAVLCRILDRDRGGWFRVAPQEALSSMRSYVGDTNVLATEFTTPTGRVRVTDFMPITNGAAEAPAIVRVVDGVDGTVDVEVALRPTFDYARGQSTIRLTPGGAEANGQGGSVVLRAPVRLDADGGCVTGVRRVGAGERFSVVLAWGDGTGYAAAGDTDALLRQTLAYWEDWSTRCTYDGPYTALVRRSALVLKLLAFAPTGAVVAAPTASLPEDVGGERNWDYRYTWLRDASLILFALQAIGYHDEADAFFGWLQDLCIKCRGDLRIMYTVNGGEDLPEQVLGHLDGYRGSKPVRVGNAAATQTQLDIYGAVLDAAHLHLDAGHGRLDPQMWEVLRKVADLAAARWAEPDEGIWEVRGPARHFLYSKLLCWVALDRAVHLATEYDLPGNTRRWQTVRDEIRHAVLDRGYDQTLGAFTQSFGDPTLDASALVVPLVGLLPPDDPRVRSTVDAVQRRLTSHGLVYRYRPGEARDGLAGEEATFALCSFWLVDNLALAGRVDEARELFERVTAYANDVGLLAEEIDPSTGQLLGNYPQGFTHLGLIRSALAIAEAERRGAQHDAERPADHARRFAGDHRPTR